MQQKDWKNKKVLIQMGIQRLRWLKNTDADMDKCLGKDKKIADADLICTQNPAHDDF